MRVITSGFSAVLHNPGKAECSACPAQYNHRMEGLV